MRVQIGAYTEDGRMIEDWSTPGGGWLISSGPHGCEILTGFVRRSKWERAYWWARKSSIRVRASAGGKVFEGRLEDTTMTPLGMRVTSLGSFRAYTDAPYTALWSATGYANWEPVTSDDNAAYNPELYEMDNNNRLYIAPFTDQAYGEGVDLGGLGFKAPHNGERELRAISFTYEMPVATGWSAVVFGYDEGFTSPANFWSLTGTAGAQNGATVIVAETPKDYFVLALYRPSSTAAFVGDTGNVHIKLTNVRIATTTENMVDTTLGTNISVGTRTVTPGSMENIFVGQALVIGGSDTERVIVTQTTATTFTAVFAFDHINTDTVKALYVSADEVAGALVDFMDGINDNQVNSGKYLIQPTGRDLPDAIWEDYYPADILTELATAHNYEVGVWFDRLLYFRPRGDAARTWYVDASVELERTLEALRNSAYSVYADDRGRLRRTAVSADDDSVEEWGIARRAAVYAETTSDGRAEDERDDYLDTFADPSPRAVLIFRRAFTASGVQVPLFYVRAGDYLVARNTSNNPQFLTARAEYDFESNTLAVEPIVRPPTVAESLSVGRKGAEDATRLLKRERGLVRVL